MLIAPASDFGLHPEHLVILHRRNAPRALNGSVLIPLSSGVSHPEV